jgi:hypothetical protein
MAGDQDDRKSTSGMIYFMLVLSTCEAEYVAAFAAAYQAIWLARLMGELLGKEV